MTVDATPESVTPPPCSPPRSARPSRTWADWAGFFSYLAFTTWILAGPRALSMLLVFPLFFELGIAVTFLIRGRPKQSLTGWAPRVMAYGATFLVPVFLRLSLAWRPSLVTATPPAAMATIGASLWLFGLAIGFWPLWHLRHSFSIEPAARALVTSGPYRIARHPIYTSYICAFVGICLLHPTIAMVVVTACWFVLMYRRVRYEERVLMAAFPEYAAYRQRVGAFGPVWRHRHVESKPWHVDAMAS